MPTAAAGPIATSRCASPSAGASWRSTSAATATGASSSGRTDLHPERTALLLCDVWDHHWCRGAQERLEPLVPRIDRTARVARERGMLVVHAPSSTMPFYAGHPARVRVLQAPPAAAPAERAHPDPTLPIDGSDSSDTAGDPAAEGTRCWSRQHAGVWIDGERDAIGDDGLELLALYRQRGIDTVLIAGVHTNMCVLNRSFAIKQLVRWSVFGLPGPRPDRLHVQPGAPTVRQPRIRHRADRPLHRAILVPERNERGTLLGAHLMERRSFEALALPLRRQGA